MAKNGQYIVWFEDLNSDDIAIAGGKNASLGEMIRELNKEGIGLARMEFIINNIIKVHPKARVRFDELEDEQEKKIGISHEDNLMLGFRGASRYYSEQYKKGFALECQAIQRAREKMGMANVVVMIPFCRTPERRQIRFVMSWTKTLFIREQTAYRCL